ncbi:hypothetical protein H9P43_003110 [Blastocladiella emersonii ATCC 22665]|nr:hypothetical protein H9P43_003110 [Blastocladiella emersonii ATCC 22665]
MKTAAICSKHQSLRTRKVVSVTPVVASVAAPGTKKVTLAHVAALPTNDKTTAKSVTSPLHGDATLKANTPAPASDKKKTKNQPGKLNFSTFKPVTARLAALAAKLVLVARPSGSKARDGGKDPLQQQQPHPQDKIIIIKEQQQPQHQEDVAGSDHAKSRRDSGTCAQAQLVDLEASASVHSSTLNLEAGLGEDVDVATDDDRQQQQASSSGTTAVAVLDPVVVEDAVPIENQTQVAQAQVVQVAQVPEPEPVFEYSPAVAAAALYRVLDEYNARGGTEPVAAAAAMVAHGFQIESPLGIAPYVCGDNQQRDGRKMPPTVQGQVMVTGSNLKLTKYEYAAREAAPVVMPRPVLDNQGKVVNASAIARRIVTANASLVEALRAAIGALPRDAFERLDALEQLGTEYPALAKLCLFVAFQCIDDCITVTFEADHCRDAWVKVGMSRIQAI